MKQINIHLPTLPEKKAESWQLKKIALAEGIIKANNIIISQNENMINLLTLQLAEMQVINKLLKRKAEANKHGI